MGTLKRKIQEQIISPVQQEYRGYTLIGRVTKIDEKNNTCDISFKDQQDKQQSIKNVPVALYNTSFVDWFPKEGDHVELSESAGSIKITGKINKEYFKKERNKIKKSKDVIPNNYNGVISGNIF